MADVNFHTRVFELDNMTKDLGISNYLVGDFSNDFSRKMAYAAICSDFIKPAAQAIKNQTPPNAMVPAIWRIINGMRCLINDSDHIDASWYAQLCTYLIRKRKFPKEYREHLIGGVEGKALFNFESRYQHLKNVDVNGLDVFWIAFDYMEWTKVDLVRIFDLTIMPTLSYVVGYGTASKIISKEWDE